MLPALRRAYPELRLHLREDLTNRLIERLLAGRLDVALIALPFDTGDLYVRELFQDEFAFVAREADPEVREKSVALRSIDPGRMVLLEEGHCLSDHIIAACGPRHGRAESRVEATSLTTLIQMVEGGLGVTLLPGITLEAGILKGTRLVVRSISPTAPSRTLALVARRTSRAAATPISSRSSSSSTAAAGVGPAPTRRGVTGSERQPGAAGRGRGRANFIENLPRHFVVGDTMEGAMTERPRSDRHRIGPDDPRYADLVGRGFNKRFSGRPDYVRVVDSTGQVVDASGGGPRRPARGRPQRRALPRGLRRGSGRARAHRYRHPMTGVAFDPERNAFVVEAGTTLGEAYRKLFLGWGVTIPAGRLLTSEWGHVLGGAFGFLCREHGLAADHLYAVEVVFVDETGTARSVVATREASDPNRDLWWAHTGGGGGNFGIVTRYWFRSLESRGSEPSGLLPKAPPRS